MNFLSQLRSFIHNCVVRKNARGVPRVLFNFASTCNDDIFP